MHDAFDLDYSFIFYTTVKIISNIYFLVSVYTYSSSYMLYFPRYEI